MKPGDHVEWFSTKRAAAHLDLSLKAFYHFLEGQREQKDGLRVHWLGGRMRFRRADLDRCVKSEPQVQVEERSGIRLAASR